MKFSSRFVLTSFIVLFCLIVGVSYWLYSRTLNTGKESRNNTLTDIRYWGEMTFGVNAINPPMEFIESDKVSGFDIEVLDAIGNEMNIEINFLDYSGSGSVEAMLGSLRNKKVDAVISSIKSTDSFPADLTATDPYLQVGTDKYVILLRKQDIELRQALNLAIATAVQNGKIDKLKAKWLENKL